MHCDLGGISWFLAFRMTIITLYSTRITVISVIKKMVGNCYGINLLRYLIKFSKKTTTRGLTRNDCVLKIVSLIKNVNNNTKDSTYTRSYLYVINIALKI